MAIAEMTLVLPGQVASGQLSRRHFLIVAGTAGLAAGLSGTGLDQALAAGCPCDRSGNVANHARPADEVIE